VDASASAPELNAVPPVKVAAPLVRLEAVPVVS
jgi:hypothetical protein